MKQASAIAVALLLVIAAPACSRGGGASQAVPFVEIDASSKSPTDQAIRKAQDKLRADPEDDSATLDLAAAFLQKARETADPSLYSKADELLGRITGDNANDVRVIVSKATLALARHEFRDGLALGRRALEVAPGNTAAYGVVVDASNELGMYDQALEATQAMVNARPNLTSLSRVSYARELRGDIDGAVLAMSQAITATGSNSGENVAYVQTLLGNLLLTKGDLIGATAQYQAAQESFAGFPAARVGEAQVLVAQEKFSEAAKILGEVVQVQPIDSYAIAWGDALTAAGDSAAAKNAYDLVEAIASLYRANGVNVDLELALYQADSDPGKKSVANARKALERRPSILGHDVLSWNLYRAGKIDEAAAESEKALATGSRDPLLRFHAAAIAAANGDREAAVTSLKIVLETNPRFSAKLLPEVRALASKLDLSVPPVGAE